MKKRLLLIGAPVLLILAFASAWVWARGSLPLLDGQLALPGLHAPVEVLIDAHGVPAAYARDAEDAWFAAGVFHARDRLWQMELYRRVTRGRLSEVLGEQTVPIDQRFLTLGLREAAEAEWQRARPEVKSALERYAAGVNAVALNLTRRQRPLEFQLLGIAPTEWTPVDSLSVGRLLAWRLAENHQAELVRGALAAKFGEVDARALGGRYPADSPAILSGAARSSDSTPRGVSSDSALRASSDSATSSPRREMAEWPQGLAWLAPGAKRGNSNNWVVAGRKTKTGRPILANDPHLMIEFPSTWYELHLVASGLDVSGVTIPGVPFVALGHNARVAWGMTNTGADVQDMFLERIDVSGKRAMWRGEWVPVEVTPVDIPVRGSNVRKFEIWKTRHGPIFADAGLDWDAPPAWLSPEGRAGGEQRAYSIRWDAGGDLASSFEAINRATDWASFTSAVNAFAVPSQNIVYADIDGNVGYAMSGRLPIRAGDGTMPIDGSGGAGEWTGAIAAEDLPRVLNPASGFIASANNEIDRSFRSVITRDWAAPYRASRLVDRLSKAEPVDMAAMEGLQTDRRSLAADFVLEGVETAIARVKGNEAESVARIALEQLANWDRIVDARSVVTLYQAFEDALWRRTFLDEMDEALFQTFYEWAGGERFAGLYAVMGDRESKWFDDLATVDRRETRDDIFILAARDAEERLQRELGRESRRGWDRVHAARYEHPLGSVMFAFGWLFSRGPVPVTGDGTTVMRISWNRLRPFQAWESPSWRQIFDVGDWDKSQVAHPSGQSGNPLSPFYFDQNEGWAGGHYRPQPFSRGAVSASARHRLMLVP